MIGTMLYAYLLGCIGQRSHNSGIRASEAFECELEVAVCLSQPWKVVRNTSRAAQLIKKMIFLLQKELLLTKGKDSTTSVTNKAVDRR